MYIQWNITIKKNEILLFTTTRSELEANRLNVISHAEKYKYCRISLLYEI